MRLLVFQHVACEHPGILRRFLGEDGIAWDAVELDEGQPIPALEAYDMLWVMGGPMDVWDVEEHPWLIEEKRAIRRWVSELERPFLGVCLGHQLLADALGGTCGPQRPAEVGVLDVELTGAGLADPFLAGHPPVAKVLNWHGVRVAQPPEGAVVLARSPACSVQAMRIGRHALSMQYHLEIEPETVPTWAGIPAYAAALERTLGPGAVDRLAEAALRELPAMTANARLVYDNLMRAARQRS